ncbi:MAG: hypothetical protein N2517_04955 [Ignavibacteria bacterium]|nr:hypothetical protein [Ignavibacteria bacterium]
METSVIYKKLLQGTTVNPVINASVDLKINFALQFTYCLGLLGEVLKIHSIIVKLTFNF